MTKLVDNSILDCSLANENPNPFLSITFRRSLILHAEAIEIYLENVIHDRGIRYVIGVPRRFVRSFSARPNPGYIEPGAMILVTLQCLPLDESQPEPTVVKFRLHSGYDTETVDGNPDETMEFMELFYVYRDSHGRWQASLQEPRVSPIDRFPPWSKLSKNCWCPFAVMTFISVFFLALNAFPRPSQTLLATVAILFQDPNISYELVPTLVDQSPAFSEGLCHVLWMISTVLLCCSILFRRKFLVYPWLMMMIYAHMTTFTTLLEIKQAISPLSLCQCAWQPFIFGCLALVFGFVAIYLVWLDISDYKGQ